MGIEVQEGTTPVSFLDDATVWNSLGELTVLHDLGYLTDENGARVEVATFDEDGRLRFKVVLPVEDAPKPLTERTIGDQLGGTLARTKIDEILCDLPLTSNRVDRAKALLLSGIPGFEIQLALRTTPATVLKARKEILAGHAAATARGETPEQLPHCVVDPLSAARKGRPAPHQTMGSGKNPLEVMAHSLGVSIEEAAVLRAAKRRVKKFRDDDASLAPEAVHVRDRGRERGGR